MSHDDGHSALKAEVVDEHTHEGLEVVIVKRVLPNNSGDTIVHICPSTFTNIGVQWTHFLELLGFQYSRKCPYTRSRRCLWRQMEGNLNASKIAEVLSQAYGHLQRADELLRETGLSLPESERGWLFFWVPEDMERYDELLRRLAEF